MSDIVFFLIVHSKEIEQYSVDAHKQCPLHQESTPGMNCKKMLDDNALYSCNAYL